MVIGIPKEIKNNEFRVPLTPGGAYKLIENSHKVYVQKSAGIDSRYSDREYEDSGALLHGSSEEAYKVLLSSGASCIAYETIESNSQFPLLAPISEVAGREADILISAIYVKGARTPILVIRDMAARMKKGSVIVAVDIDQGSSIKTVCPTTHRDPIYMEEGVIHYCVANMPGVFSRTSTLALTYVKKIAGGGIAAVLEDPELFSSLNIYKGSIAAGKRRKMLG